MWQWDRARPHLRIATRLFEEQHGRKHESVARCLSLLGRAMTFARHPESVTLQREGLATRRELFGREHPQVAESLGNLGYALWHGASPPRWREAEKCYRDALAMYARVGQNDRRDEARFTFSLGVMLRNRWRFEDSERTFKKALAMYRERPNGSGAASSPPNAGGSMTADDNPSLGRRPKPGA